MNNDADRVVRYEGFILDLEVEAMALVMQARRPRALPDMCHSAAARRAGELGLYRQKADDLRGIAA